MSLASRAVVLSRKASRTALTHLKTAHAQAGLSKSVRCPEHLVINHSNAETTTCDSYYVCRHCGRPATHRVVGVAVSTVTRRLAKNAAAGGAR